MKYCCPCCKSDQVLVYEKTSYWLNTMEVFCHSVKAFDSDAEVKCANCDFTGVVVNFYKEKSNV